MLPYKKERQAGTCCYKELFVMDEGNDIPAEGVSDKFFHSEVQIPVL